MSRTATSPAPVAQSVMTRGWTLCASGRISAADRYSRTP